MVTREAGNERAECRHTEDTLTENRLLLLISFAAGTISSFKLLIIQPAEPYLWSLSCPKGVLGLADPGWVSNWARVPRRKSSCDREEFPLKRKSKGAQPF